MAPVAAHQETDLTDTESVVTESDESEKQESVKEVRVTFKLPESTKDDEVSIFFVVEKYCGKFKLKHLYANNSYSQKKFKFEISAFFGLCQCLQTNKNVFTIFFC